jgi:hypothetical protein
LAGTFDILVFLVVVLARFGIPLFIPRFPLPSIVAAMLLDAADQTIFQQFTDLDLSSYQSYDKALDVYYLAIAYISTLRNWTNATGYATARFLWCYRLIGVAAFELTQWRALLLVFPNTFEYFFMWFEAVRLRWNPIRLTRQQVIGAAAFIWIVIKLPQEYWIHVAQLDTTDLLKERVLGVSVDTRWSEALSQNLWVFPVLLVLGLAVVVLLRRVRRRLPEPDWALSFDVDTHLEPVQPALVKARRNQAIRHGLIEKIVLVGLVSVIFSRLLPSVDTHSLAVFSGVAFVVAVNAFVSHWFAARGTHWRSLATEFVAMAAVNLAAGLVYVILLPGNSDNFDLGAPLFLTLLLTLIVTLYDRYRPVHDARMSMIKAQGDSESTISAGSGPETKPSHGLDSASGR